MTDKQDLVGDVLDGLLNALRSAGPGAESAAARRLADTVAPIGAAADRAADEAAQAYAARSADALAVLQRRRARIEAYAGRERRAVPPRAGIFSVAGRVVEAQERFGLPNVSLRLVHGEEAQPKTLARGHTDALGYFRLDLDEAALDALDGASGSAGLRLEALDGAGDARHTVPVSAAEAGATAFHGIGLDGAEMPRIHALGASIAGAVEASLAGLDLTARLIRAVPAEILRPVAPAGWSDTKAPAEAHGGTQDGKESRKKDGKESGKDGGKASDARPQDAADPDREAGASGPKGAPSDRDDDTEPRPSPEPREGSSGEAAGAKGGRSRRASKAQTSVTSKARDTNGRSPSARRTGSGSTGAQETGAQETKSEETESQPTGSRSTESQRPAAKSTAAKPNTAKNTAAKSTSAKTTASRSTDTKKTATAEKTRTSGRRVAAPKPSKSGTGAASKKGGSTTGRRRTRTSASKPDRKT